MDKIDCFGDVCPVPLLKIQSALKKHADGERFMVVVDHSCVMESINDYYNNTTHEIIIDEVMNGVWEITVIKHLAK